MTPCLLPCTSSSFLIGAYLKKKESASNESRPHFRREQNNFDKSCLPFKVCPFPITVHCTYLHFSQFLLVFVIFYYVEGDEERD